VKDSAKLVNSKAAQHKMRFKYLRLFQLISVVALIAIGADTEIHGARP
jgi:hypothetical protein